MTEYVFKISTNDVGVVFETPNAVIQKQEDHFEVLAATSNDIREAIDEAMDSVGTR